MMIITSSVSQSSSPISDRGASSNTDYGTEAVLFTFSATTSMNGDHELQSEARTHLQIAVATIGKNKL